MDRTIDLPMDVRSIQECIPHRYPFLLVERIVEYSHRERIVGIKNVSINEPHLQGHFPGEPIMPGVLLIEGIAQTAAVFGHFLLESGCSNCYLTEIKNARFRKQVVPGDQVRYDLQLKRVRKPFFWFDGQALVGEDVVAEVTFSAYMS